MRKSLQEIIQFALTMELLLVVIGEIVPGADTYLPLGHSHLKQIAAVVILAIAIHAVITFFAKPKAKTPMPSKTEGSAS